MTESTGTGRAKFVKPAWYDDLKNFAIPDTKKAIWQLVNTLVPYFVIWGVMIYTIKQGYSYWITLALAVLGAGFLTRIFIIFHDCGHGSFLASRRANTLIGYITGILTFTPYEDWRKAHAIHHATVGDLDRRGTGDVYTMTLEEYKRGPWYKKLGYRVYRNPFVLFILSPAPMFMLAQRIPHKGAGKRERRSVLITDLAILGILLVAYFTIGLKTYLLIQVPIMAIAGTFGVWLFYVQHQYQGVYWARHDEWDPIKSAVYGSSFYKLPKILQWFSGNIGFHHIHHLRPTIPNYNLERCYNEIPALQEVKALTLKTSIKSLWYNLYDEENKRMVSFSQV